MAAPNASVSKEEYLKRYLCSEDDKNKKKSKKIKPRPAVKVDIRKSKIVDDDIDLRYLSASMASNELDLEYGEEAPQVAAVVDERPAKIIEMEAFQRTNRWRVLGARNQSNSPTACPDADLSPVRPPQVKRRTRHDSDGGDQSFSEDDGSAPHRHPDRSPDGLGSARKPRKSVDSRSFPKRREAKDFFDQSPLRSKARDSPDQPWVGQHKRRLDQSPDSNRSPQSSPRRAQNNSDQSPPRRNKNASDQSPTRRSKKNITDHNPPRQKRSNTDQSPPRRGNRNNLTDHATSKNDSDSDQSPPHGKTNLRGAIRIKEEVDSDQSPPRRSQQDSPARTGGKNEGRVARSRWDPADTIKSDRSSVRSDSRDGRRSTGIKSLPTKTLDGKMAGLQDAATLKSENDAAKQREQRMFEQLGDEFLGRNAQTIVRDRASGKQRDLDAEGREKAKEEAEKAVREAKYKEWSKGLKQRELQEQAVATIAHEMTKPLARYDDDADLDHSLREQERTGDPMLEYMRKKKAAERRATTGEPVKELPRYKGPAPPPNRYNIGPGYRWDGVDRSNGFEKSRVSRQTNKMAVEEDAYKWSVENM